MDFVRKCPWLLSSLALFTLAVLGTPGPAWAQADPAVPETPRPKELAVSPSATTVPVLKYRLLPSTADLNPGDAAPIYLRIHGYEDSGLQEHWKQIGEKAPRWMAMPMKEFPVAEARAFVNVWSGRLKQLEFGTRRKTCDWNYTLAEQRLDAVEILLPDAQSMRQWGRVLALKARVEIADGKLEEAIRTVTTGLAFARHLGGGPFLINGLVGIATANVVLDTLDDLIGQPGAPNLYWALTALPRPLVSLRDQLEVEERICESLVPELSEVELSKSRTPAEWASYLARMHERIVRWSRRMVQSSQNSTPQLRELAGWDLDRLKSELLLAAKTARIASSGQNTSAASAMSDDELVARYFASRYRELRDDLFRSSYLPADQALPQFSVAEKRVEAARSPAMAFFLAIHADGPLMYMRPLSAQVGLDRRVAALRVIEALRLYAAAHQGALPEMLEQVTEVPMSLDPATGKPFLYRRAGSAALLHAPQAGLRTSWTPYRITVRGSH
jgi:hypothetical protein